MHPDPASFDHLLATLNPAQRQVVEHIDGPIQVVAGPGTGKTHTIAARIGFILRETDTSPRSILALTFTEAAAHTMRERLVQHIGPTGYQVAVQTFHGFCASVLATHPDAVPHWKDQSPIDDAFALSLLQEILNADPDGWEYLRPINAPELYLKALWSRIGELKRESVSPEKLRQLADDQLEVIESAEAERSKPRKTVLAPARKHHAKQHELARVYEQYLQRMHELGKGDFTDLIVETVAAFATDDALLGSYQEQYQYLHVDEYQDSNQIQNQLVEQLAAYWGEAANLCVVGDPNQSIFRFQGAAVENTYRFAKSFPSATLVVLETGYRCPPPIYAVAHTLLTAAPPQAEDSDPTVAAVRQALRAPLRAAVAEETQIEAVRTAVAPTIDDELRWVAQQVRVALDEGVPAEEIAVLYRTNKEADRISAHLSAAEIPHTLVSDAFESVAIFQRELQQTLTYLLKRTENSSKADPYLHPVLAAPWLEHDRVELLTLLSARKRSQSLRELMTTAASGSQPLSGSLTPLTIQPIRSSIEQLDRVAASLPVQPPHQWYAAFLRDSGVFEWSRTQPDAARRLLVLKGFAQLLGQSDESAQKALARVLEQLENDRVKLPLPTLELTQAVSLCTAHKAKGREWRRVFITNAVSGNWGGRRSPELLPLPFGILDLPEFDEDPEAEERRLFYVALTRAAEQVTISWSTQRLVGVQYREELPSQFVIEAGQKPRPESKNEAVPGSEAAAQILLGAEPMIQYPAETAALFSDLVAQHRISASSLNTYLANPSEFVERYLLRLPSPPEPVLAHGSAMHAALERIVIHHTRQDQGPASLEAVLEVFERELSRYALEDDEARRRIERARAVLPQIYTELNAELQTASVLAVERFFGQGERRCVIEGIELTGKIDRIDVVDRAQKRAKLIDYKTGKVRSAGYITGSANTQDYSERELALPETIRGRYQRQLVFYALLTQLDPTFQWTIDTGSFVFVEPDTREQVMTERKFEITPAAIDDLTAVIREVWAELQQLKFISSSAA